MDRFLLSERRREEIVENINDMCDKDDDERWLDDYEDW